MQTRAKISEKHEDVKSLGPGCQKNACSDTALVLVACRCSEGPLAFLLRNPIIELCFSLSVPLFNKRNQYDTHQCNKRCKIRYEHDAAVVNLNK
jgi:hypothetical protein